MTTAATTEGTEGIGLPGVPDLTRGPRLRTAVARVGGVALAVKLVLTAKDLAVAQAFGTSAQLDVFLLAFAMSQFAMTVIAGSFASALVPTYIEVRERDGHVAAGRLFAGTFHSGLRVLLGAAVLLAVAGPVLLHVLVPDRANAGPDLALVLFFLLLPTLLLNGASVAWAAVLGAEGRYSASVAPQILAPLAPLAAVLVLSAGRPDVRWLAMATTVGFAIEAGATGHLLRRAGVPLLPHRQPVTDDARMVTSQFLPVAAGGCMMASTLLVDQAMSVGFAEGSVSALSYGGKAVSFLASAGSLALSAAALPHFSRLAATGDRSQLVAVLRRWAVLVLAAAVPATLVLIVVSRPLISLVLEHGAFTSEDTMLVSRVQQLMLLQLPAYFVGILFVRVISALKANVVLLWGAAINLVVNIGLNLLLGPWLGVAGIALSTAAVYWVSTIFLGLMLIRRLPTKEPDDH